MILVRMRNLQLNKRGTELQYGGLKKILYVLDELCRGAAEGGVLRPALKIGTVLSV